MAAATAASPAAAQVDDCPGGVPENPAGSPFVWNEPQCLSASENNGEAPQVAIAENGTAIAVWRYQDPRNDRFRVQYSIRERGGNFTPAPSPPVPIPPATTVTPEQTAEYNAKLDATFLSPANRDVGTHIRVKMNKAGDAIVVWNQKEDNQEGSTPATLGVYSAYRPAGGEFGAAQTVVADATDPSFARSYVEPEAGIDGDGDATVIYHQRPMPFGVSPSPAQSSVYEAKSRPAGVGSTWGTATGIIDRETGSETNQIGYTDTHGKLSVNEAGDRWVSFAYRKYGGQDGSTERQVVKLAERTRNEASWSERGEEDIPGPDPEVTDTYTELQDGGDFVRGTFGWSEGNSLHIQDEELSPPFSGPTGGSGALIQLTPRSSDDSPDAIALWSDDQRRLRATRASPFGQPFPSPDAEPIPGNEAGERTRPALANFDDGADLAVFQQKVGSDSTVQAALLPKDGGTDFQDPIALSAPGDLELDGPTQVPFPDKTHSGPQIAANSDGEAVAAWSGFVAGNLTVQVSILTPRSDPEVPPPPPPPARPRPAVTSPIQFARDPARDQATVLIAEVPDDIEKVEWKFESRDEPPIEGTTENGKLQRTVRLRLPNTAFRASLRTFGPDGVKEYSRTLASLQPSASKEVQQVVAGIQKAAIPPVFAVGEKDVLTGKSKECAPTKVWTGEQKMSGCLKPVEGLADIPSLERGALHEVSTALKLDETKKELMEKATQLTDGYVAKGRALLNDEFPVIPKQGASVVSIAQAKSLVSANATLPVGSATYDPKNGFNLKVDPKKIKIPLGKLPKPPKLPSLGGLEIVGDWNVDLEKREAKIKASVVFPKEITKAGLKLENEINLRATADRIIVDSARIGPIDADIGALKVTAFQISYQREGDEWLGQAKACIIKASCFDMSPPNGSIRVKGGRVVFAGASLFFPHPGIPLFTGVNLTKVGFGMGFDPTRIVGSARIQALQLVSIEGRLVLAFPSSRTPFILRREEVGPDFPDGLYGKSFTGPTVGVTGAAGINLPALGDIEVAKGHVLYEYPGYVAFGGGFDLDLLKIVQLRGGLSGEFDLDRELFNVHGRIEACLVDVACGSAVANVSRGPNSAGGAGACVSLLGVSVGGGVQWRRLSEPFIWPFDGCKWSRFKLDVRASQVRSAAGGFVLDVREGAPSPAIKLYGQGGAPIVVVRGPDGQVLNSNSPKNIDVSPGGKIRIIRFPGNQHAEPFTVVGLQDAKPGRYTIETLPGSASVTKTAQATDPPDAKVTGKVTGKDRRRVLTYDVRAREGQRVTFQEVAPGGATKAIGSTTKGGRGKLRFDSAPGRGRRQIFAQFELSGVPAERELVTSFNPASPRLAKVKGVRVRRKGSTLRVTWRKVAGATSYEVGARMSGRRMTFARTAKTGVRFKVPKWFAGRLTVRAIDDIRQSPVSGGARFKATSAEPSPFRPLEQCKVGKRSIRCLPPKRFCGGRRATIVSEPGRRTVGTAKADVIVGTPGADIIEGRGGNDLICGDGGDDTITGGAGGDRIRGGAGMDSLFGNSGNDRIRGGPGNDALRGDVGNDRLRGDSGNDTITGDLGRDKLSSGPNRDTLDGGSGKDRLNGGSGKDRVNGGPGKDRVRENSRQRARDATR